MSSPLFNEITISSEVNLEGSWQESLLHLRLGPPGLMSLQFEDDQGSPSGIEIELWQFDVDLLGVFRTLGSSRIQSGEPLWRARVALPFAVGRRRTTRHGVLFLQSDVRFPSSDQPQFGFAFDTGDEETVPLASDLCQLLYRFPRSMGDVCCCGTCRFGDAHTLGGTDWAFGLYCFRDNPSALREARSLGSPEEWAAVSHSNTPALHVCPRYERRDHAI